MKRNHLLAPFALFALATGCKQEYTAPAPDGAPTTLKQVRVEKPGRLERPIPVLATGVVSAKEEIVLSFKTGGILKRLAVDEGNAVAQGQLLAQLDLSEITAQVASAKNTFDKSERDLQRTTNLYHDTVATLEQKQNAATAREIAKANLDIATFNLRYSKILSPIKGKVLTRFAETGELVSPGQPIYKIGSSDTKGSQIVRTGISDKEIAKLQLGDAASIGFDAFPENRYSATVTEIGELANARTGLFEIELTLDDHHGEIKNGFIGKISIVPSRAPKSYKIPMDALVEGRNRTATVFYTTDQKTVQRAEVAVDQFRDDYFTVRASSIPVGALIVKEGAPYLKANDSIKIVR